MGRRDGRSTDIQCLVLANLDRTLGSQKETEMYKMLLINCRTISRTHYNKDIITKTRIQFITYLLWFYISSKGN